MVDIVKEKHQMHFIASPRLTILGAAYGLKSVKGIIVEKLKNRSLSVVARNKIFGDLWEGHEKTLTVVCQYGDEKPMTVVKKEGSELQLLYTPRPIVHFPTDPRCLTILGATYGPKDVTDEVERLVKNCRTGTLQLQGTNKIFGDSWKGNTKTLVIVYQYGQNAPQTVITKEKETVSLSVPIR
jgi:hypothetical protein